MKNNKTKSAQTMSMTLTVSILAFLIACVSLSLTLFQSQSPDQAQQDTIQSIQYNHSRLQFCYDQKIACDDISIEAWNKDHPADKFHL